MNHRERMEACLSGNRLDRPPVALWRHFPVDDQNSVSLARSIIFFQERYDFDFVKITPASSFCVNDYGVTDEWKGNPEGTRIFTNYPIHDPADWTNLSELAPDQGSLQQQLECIKLVRSGVGYSTPVIQTIFSPLAQAKNLVGKENLAVHLRKYPEELKQGLRTIANNTIAFLHECIKLGIDGIFFAVQHAQASLLSLPELRDFQISYDLEILSEVKDLWLNVGHLHGRDIYFEKISKYPVSIINWHDQETQPTLAEAKQLTDSVVCGGLRQWETLVYGNAAQVSIEAKNALLQTRGERFVLGTGCVLPIIAPRSNIEAVRRSVEDFATYE